MGGRRLLALCASLLLALALSPAAGAAGAGARVDGMVIPLAAPTPEWYTDELHRRAEAAGRRGDAVPLPDGVEVESSLVFAGIRPGSWMISPAWCTLNFVFGNPDSSTSGVYIGTAGHCADVGESVSIVAAPGVVMNIGTTVKSVDNGIGDDFALIEIYPEMVQYVNPSIALVAGPTGSLTPSFGTPVVHVGHGVGVGTGGTVRAGVVTWQGTGREAAGYGWNGAATPGDSGSGVRAVGGQAVGNLTHLVVGTRYLPASVVGTGIARMLQIAGAPLATATLLPDPLP